MRSCKSGVLTPSNRLIAAQACVTARLRTNPQRTKSPSSTAISRFSSTLSLRKQPVSLRSPVPKAMPHDRARARRRAREDLRQLAAHHHANELIAGEVEGTCRADVSAVAQHGYLIRDLEQLVHLVGDVENALPLRPQLANDREQVLRVLLGRPRGRPRHHA